MRRLIAVVAAVGALGMTPTVVAAEPSAPVAHAACRQATIGGQSKCIARGQFCARRYQRDYRRYGYSCSNRDRRGNWHLR